MKKLQLLIALAFCFGINIQAQTITTGTVSTTVCAGATISVPYTITGTFTAGNVFTAQLSNSAGTFTSPVNIGTLTSTAAGTITATIPSSTAQGLGYRIRVVSSTPAITGTSNPTNITVNVLPTTPTITAGGATTFCSGGSVVLTGATTSGNALDFDGSTDFINVPSSTSPFTGNADHTIEFNVLYKGGQTGHRWLLWYGSVGVANNLEVIGYDGETGKIKIHHVSTGNDKTATTAALTPNVWTHVALVYTGSSRTTAIYINGVLVETITFTVNLAIPANAQIQLGTYASNADGVSFSCKMTLDEVRIWNATRTQSQIQATMNKELVGTESNLKLYYNFNQGSAAGTNTSVTTLTDKTTSGYTGTLNNFALTGATSNWVQGFPLEGASWLWSNGSTTQAITATTSANYTVQVTNSSGCQSAASAATVVTVNALPTITASATTTAVCQSTSAQNIYLAYSATTNSPTTYSIGGTYEILPTSPITIAVPANTAAGTYPGTLTVKNANGCVSTGTNFNATINALPALAANGGGASTVCVNATTPAFTNAQSGGTWSIVAGTGTASVSSGGVVTGLTAGTVSVKYTYSNGTCSNSVVSSLTVNALPTLSANASGTATVCVNATTAAFTNAQSGGTWSIVAGTGTASVSTGGVVTGLTSGTVSVKYTYSNGTCSNSVSSSVTVNALPTLSANGGGAATVCVNATTAAFTNAQAGGTWSIVAGTGTASVSTGGVVTGLTAGTVSVKYTYSNGTCSNSVSSSVFVNALPTLSANGGGAATVCVNATTAAFTNAQAGGTWSIVAGTGTASVSTGGVVTGLTAGTVSVKYTYSNGTCSNSVSSSVTVNALPTLSANAGGAASVCVNATTAAFTNAQAGGTWSIVAGTGTASVSTGGVVTGLTAGTVSVVYSYSNGTCSNSVSSSVTVNALPTATISGNTSFCTGGNTVLTSTATAGSGTISSYQWKVGGVNVASGGTSATYTAAVAGSYTVTVTNSNGCVFTSTAYVVTVSPASVGGTVAGSATVCTGTNSTALTLSGHTGDVTKWQSSTSSTFASAVTDVANTTTTLTATNLSATTYYRAVITSGICAAANSTTATVTVSTPSVGGTIAGSASVCTGTNSTALTLSGHTGSITKWQSSTSSTFASAVTDVANTTTTLTATNLSATTYYRAVITSGACAAANSATATVTVNALPTTPTITAGGATTFCSGGSVALNGVNETLGNGLDFDGSNDFINVPSSASPFTGNADHTIEFNVLYKGGQTGDRWLLWYGTAGVGNALEVIGYNGATGKLKIHHLSAGNDITATTAALTPNVWTHVALVYTGSSRTTAIYINGALVETFTFAANLAIPTNAQIQLGTYASYADGINFSCKMTLDEFRIWNATRTQSQIQASMNTELVGTESNLKLYYNFNQGNAAGTNSTITTLTDRTISGYTGTLNNFGLTGATSNWVQGFPLQGGSWLWSNGSITQAFTATASGSYTVQVTQNGCQSAVSAATVVTVIPNYTVGAASSAPTLCMNTPLTNITHGTTGVTGILDSPSSTYTPASVVLSWANFDLGNVTISLNGSTVLNNTTPFNSLSGTIGTASGTAGSYSDFSAFGPFILIPGSTYSFSLSSITDGTRSSNAMAIYIDYNRNGVFTDAGEKVYAAPYPTFGGHTEAGTFTIPANNSLGLTRMRVICGDERVTSPTTNYTYGEYEDYNIKIGNGYELLPGVSATWSNNLITISGSPTVTGIFNYAIPLTGCGSDNAAGTITVTANNSVGVASSTPTLCINAALTNITHTTTGASGIGTATGLPSGVTASWATNTITISGTPTTAGTFNYAIPLTGCGNVNATGTITVKSPAVPTIYAGSATTLCSGSNVLLEGVSKGNALDFDGSNDFINVPSSASPFTGNADHTIEFKVFYKGGQTGDRWLAWYGTAGVANALEVIGYNGATGKLKIHHLSAGNDITATTAALTPNVWTHVALVYTGSGKTTAIYINGVLVETFTYTANLAIPTNSQLQIGTYASVADGVNFSCKMTVEEFRIWDVVRTQSQIQAKMNTELVGTESNLQLYYNFNQGTASVDNTSITTLTNQTTIGYIGTLNNFGLTGATSNWVEGISLTEASWIWSNGATTPFIYANNAGNYTVQVTNNGCQSVPSAATVVTTVNALTTLSANAGGAAYVCVNATTPAFTNVQAGGTWSVVAGTGSASVSTSGVVTGLSAGTVSVVYTYDNGTCSGSVNSSLTVNALPTITTSAIATVVCQSTAAQNTSLAYSTTTGTPTTYSISWSGSPTNSFVAVTDALLPTSLITIAVPANTSATIFTGMLMVKNDNGCVSAGTPFTVTVDALPSSPTITAGGATTFCSGGSVVLNGTTTNIGNALDFDGSNDYAQAPIDIWFTGNYTIETWIYPRTFSSWARVIDFGKAAGMSNVLLAYTEGTSGKPSLVNFNNQSNTGSLTSSTLLELNKWSHLAVSFNGTTANMYINGVLVATGPMSAPDYTTREISLIGKSNWPDPTANAIFDELRIWNVARSQAEIQAAMNKELVGTESNLKLYYNFNQGTIGGTNTGVTTLTDKTINGKNATLNNFALTGTTSNWVEGCPSLPLLTPLLWSNGVTAPSITVTSSGSYTAQSINANGCQSAASAATVVTVSPSLTASVDIVSNNAAFPNPLTFTATPANGGSAPVYQWYDGSTPVGTNSSTYTTQTLTMAQTLNISVVMTSNATPCLTGSPATSNTLTINTPLPILPVTGLKLNGYATATANLLNWYAYNEREMNDYTIERSLDGLIFNTIGNQPATVSANGNNSYNYTDNHPLNGLNYYRIKGNSNNGQIQFSNIITIKFGSKQPTLLVAPNPVEYHLLSLKVVQLKKGVYTLKISDVLGRLISKRLLLYDGVNGTIKTSLPQTIKAGVYYVKLIGEGSAFTEKFIIQ